MFVDLHTHTTCSDGTMTPEELVSYAKEKNLKAVAITDHDTVSGNERALREGKLRGIEVIPGVEFSVHCKRGSLHILGLFIDSQSTRVRKAVEELQRKRRERNIKILYKLDEIGIKIRENTFLNYAYLGRPHIAQELVRLGYAKTIREAFEKYLKKGKAAYVDREKLPERVTIETVVEAGGLPVLAHPVTVFNFKGTIERLIVLGLKGIEVYYPTHSRHDTEYFLTFAQEHNLLITGGSDFHGAHKPEIDLGCMKVPAYLLDRLKEYMNNQRNRRL
jgi:predicted metal-dependent phosphoesterase TrpH